MKRCVIIGAADIGRYDIARGYLRPGDFCIFCDGGLKHREPLGVRPDLIVGDFDSWDPGSADAAGDCPEIIRLPREKDDTDTFYAAKEAVRRGFDEFTLLGAAGGRLDHTLGNVSILLFLAGRGKKALMADDLSEMEIVTAGTPAFIPDSFPYFSVLNITGDPGEITIEDSKYLLENGKITCDFQYGISNETLPGRTARVTVSRGELLLVKVFDPPRPADPER